ncbi:RAMP superfamily CRISPR-associated protein [Aliarcobacter cryaerophilus]|uniref:RAMP superfamily CRISPR-associated protein n=1 Tax=Aliarcobacter cryaerophilus TaxID=28198 RepID=UPI0021B6AD0C|nr:RAMP superfamily CRISPR-associated protein [Aliarcobacter cryaerophilus]MCT7535693.1 RAMP superfamily CRISPR-associated protein [Aliarcobacter cryaerophilus]
MAKYKITTLSPLHIGSGEEYELNFNLLYKDGFIYIYDEFKLVEFFILKNIEIPTKIEALKENILRFKDEIISSNLHKRKIFSSFTQISKPVLEQVSTQNNPIITGSSIKGAIKTAYIYRMVQNDELKGAEKDLIKRIDGKITNITKTIFRNLKISDSFTPLSTQIFKSINIKKEKSHQSKRGEKVNQIANFTESIKVGESTEITINISDKYFDDLKTVCNEYYQLAFNKEFDNYFLNKLKFPKINLKPNQFLLNIGRFSGAELKSIDEIRRLSRTGADVDWETSARTYALEKNIQDNTYFENSLLPFGWLLCELVD